MARAGIGPDRGGNVQLVSVDAFTAEPFAGNPAAVAVVKAFPDDARMQAIARPARDRLLSRVFASNQGIPEDPVTRAAHCTLAVFWGDRLGRNELVGEQASARGGVIRMRREGDRVVLVGQAVTVARVDLLV